MGGKEKWDRRNRASSPEIGKQTGFARLDPIWRKGRKTRSFFLRTGFLKENPKNPERAGEGLRLFESALRRKIGQLSVLEFELPYGPRDDSID
jgi:hypothetical protein